MLLNTEEAPSPLKFFRNFSQAIAGTVNSRFDGFLRYSENMRRLGLAILAKSDQNKRLTQCRWQASDLFLHDFKRLTRLQFCTWVRCIVSYYHASFIVAVKFKKLPDPTFTQKIAAFIDCNPGEPRRNGSRQIKAGELEPSSCQRLLNGIFGI